MTRNQSVTQLQFIAGIDDPLLLCDWLQLRGLISDNCISPKSAATCDLLAAVEKLTEDIL